MQRRVYDALNVLSALDIIRKDKSHIIYNNHNPYIEDDDGDDSFDPNESESKVSRKLISDLKPQIVPFSLFSSISWYCNTSWNGMYCW